MVGTNSNITIISKDDFSVIYRDHYSLLVKYTYSIVRNKEQAQDIVADLFCDLWNTRQKINVHTNLQNYLLVSARRMANKQLMKLSMGMNADGNSTTLDDDDPHTEFIRKENAVLLEQLLAGLTPQKREVVQLRLAGLTYHEIAAALNTTPKKVEYHLSTAICLLREEVKSKSHLKELSFLLLLPTMLHEVTIW